MLIWCFGHSQPKHLCQCEKALIDFSPDLLRIRELLTKDLQTFLEKVRRLFYV